jgi:hypothetical protein
MEFDGVPTLINNELVCRMVHGPGINAGKPRACGNTFEIPLHRWRDSLGKDACGLIQVHCDNKWIDIVRLTGTKPPDGSEGLPLIKELNIAIADLDWERIEYYAEVILDNFNNSILDEIYRIAVARALLFLGKYKRINEILSPINNRDDIPEAGLYMFQARLRQGQLNYGEINELENKVQLWPDSTAKNLVLAELSYKIGRMGQEGKGALQACRRYISEIARESFNFEIVLIDSIAAFLLNEDHMEYPCTENKLYTYCKDVLEIMTFVKQYLNKPLQLFVNNLHLKLNFEIIRKLWVANDVNLITMCLAQANGDLELAGNYLEKFEGNREEIYKVIKVLKARQLFLTGQKEKARKAYIEIINDYPFIIDEIPV